MFLYEKKWTGGYSTQEKMKLEIWFLLNKLSELRLTADRLIVCGGERLLSISLVSLAHDLIGINAANDHV